MPIWVIQSLRLFRHELKRGELTIICCAIVLAVATVFSLSGFSEQIKSALISESSSFIAADRVLQSSRPVKSAILEQAKQAKLQKTEMLLFSSMVFAGDEMLLASVKAVSDTYPLRGELLVIPKGAKQAQALSAPQIGTLWVAQSLLEKLSIEVGDSIELGMANFIIAGVIEKEPDASFSVFTQGPRVLLNFSDVGKTQIVQPGSRLTYRYLFAGDTENIDSFEQWLTPKIEDNQRWYDIKSQQSPLANALTRAEKFLSLASMLGIILAAVAVSVASRRYGQRHQPMVAVFKAMGASKKHIIKLYFLHWGSLSLFAISIGIIIGYLIQSMALSYMSSYLPNGATQTSFYPLFVAVFTGVICAFAFAIKPMQELISTSALSVIRGFNGVINKHSWLSNLPAFVAVLALLLIFSQDILLSVVLLLSSCLVVLVLLFMGRLIVNAGRKVGSGAGQSFHLAIANLKRRAEQNNVQLVSFTIAIMLLLLMLVVRTDLIDDWQAQLPEHAPNQFLVNISKQQVTPVKQFLAENSLQASQLYPIIRGRLTAINDEKLRKRASKEQDDKSDGAREGLGRELNMTWQSTLPTENIIKEGQWFSSDSTQAEVSIESTLADRLQIKLGDTLSFQIGSDLIELPVTSIREVNWKSMQPNFYMIFNDQVLNDFPATYIAALHVPKQSKLALQQFLSQYPTISVIDVDAMITQLRGVIEQVSVAIEFILILVVLAGSLVLVAQVQASMEERERELAILRTLGAKGSLLRNSTVLEFVILGAVAGFLASIAMEISAYFLHTQVLDMQASLHWPYWLLAMALGAGFVGLVGLLSCRRLLNLSSLTLIKRTL